MPFETTGLISLLNNSGFSLWLYRTTDTRATALATGYFAPAAGQLAVGDVMLLQASDALTLTTVRPSNVIAPGLVVDTAVTPFRVNRNSHQRFSVRQVASAVVMTVLLAPLLGGIVAGSTVQAQAAVTGPVEQVVFSIRDANGVTVSGPQTAPVNAGAAVASLPAPDVGSGYRLRVEALGQPGVVDTSPAFAVSPAYALLLDGTTGVLLQENGSRLLN